MVSKNCDIANSHEREIQEMLEIGLYLGAGPRYLLYYYGQLAITNDAGLMRWPKGPRVIVAVVTARECAGGLSPARKEFLLARLRLFEGLRKRQYPRAFERGRLSATASNFNSDFCHVERSETSGIRKDK